MATELAKAYVQILPSARGMKDSLEKTLKNEMPSGEEPGHELGSSIAGGIKKAIAAAGIGKVIKSALGEGAALEQSIGGVETLFKDRSDTVIQNAENAYKTAGLSANDYMETVTSFAATLLQGLGGDTQKAAEIADQAIIAMSDNSNKFGTDMQSVMNAYMGFSKQNYAMLDNLKLGYGGTASEMARLINDSGVLGDTMKVTVKNVNSVSFDKVIEAIGVVQDKLGVTGTTAKEAATTFSGSMASMKAATKNLLGALSSGKNVEEATDTFVSTAETFLNDNFIPMLGRVLNSAGKFIIQAIKDAPEFLSKLVKQLDFDSAAALFATTMTPKAAKQLWKYFKEDSDTRASLQRAGQSIGNQIGNSTVGTAAETGTNFTTKFSKALSTASAIVSAAIIGWDIGTMIYNCAKPGIDRITDSLVDAFHTDEYVEGVDNYIEMKGRERVADLIQKGAYWLHASDWNNDYVINRAARMLGDAKTYGLDVDTVFATYYEFGDNDKVIAQRLQALSSEAANSGKDMVYSFATAIVDSDAIAAAVLQTAQDINSVLGFSEPEKGPLSDFHTYAPDMMKLYAQGIADNRHLVEDEVVSLMNSVRGTMNEPVEFSSSMSSGTSDAGARVIILRLTDNAGRIIAETAVDAIDELQGASVLLSERGLAR